MIGVLYSRELVAFRVADRVAQILANEEENQRALAATPEAADALRLKVYAERSLPWHDWVTEPEPGQPVDLTTRVNVRLASEDFGGGGNLVGPRADAAVVIECIAPAIARDLGAGAGHTPSDVAAASAVRSAAGFVVHALMSSEYAWLGWHRGELIGKRWIENIRFDYPIFDGSTVHQVRLAEIRLAVELQEEPPQAESVPLEELAFTFLDRTIDGQVVAQVDYAAPEE